MPRTGGTRLHGLQELAESVEIARRYAHLSSEHLAVDRVSELKLVKSSDMATIGLQRVK
jgi:hypothetical protein